MGAMTLVAVGVGVQAFGQYSQGQAAKTQGKAEQQILEYNATLKEREGAAELERARAEAEMFSKEGEAWQATQNVQIAKGGVLATEGTPALVLEKTRMELKADRMAILREGFLSESFRKSEAENLRFEGRVAVAKGKNISTGYTLAAIGTLLTGMGTLYSMGASGGGKSGGQKPPGYEHSFQPLSTFNNVYAT